LLSNPSFESPVQASVGNNLSGLNTFGLWRMESGGTFNIIKTNGSVYSGGQIMHKMVFNISISPILQITYNKL
jgi:hypothetical protein